MGTSWDRDILLRQRDKSLARGVRQLWDRVWYSKEWFASGETLQTALLQALKDLPQFQRQPLPEQRADWKPLDMTPLPQVPL